MSKTEYGLKAIMYSAYDTPHKLCNISVNQTIQQPRLPPNNAGRPMRQFKCPLAWCKWRAGPPLQDFVFSWGGGGSQREGCIGPGAGISPCANRMGKHVNSIAPDYLCHYMDVGTLWHFVLASCNKPNVFMMNYCLSFCSYLQDIRCKHKAWGVIKFAMLDFQSLMVICHNNATELVLLCD